MDWIDCNDKLPEEAGNILVIIGGEFHVALAREPPIGVCYRSLDIEPFAYYELGRWITHDVNLNQIPKAARGQGKWILPKKWKEPTHWIPIPKFKEPFPSVPELTDNQ